MNTAHLQPGTVVECNVKGRRFEAPVTGKPAAGEIEIEPPRGITYRRLRNSQVRGIISLPPSPQLQLGGL